MSERILGRKKGWEIKITIPKITVTSKEPREQEKSLVISEEAFRAYKALMEWANRDGPIEDVTDAFTHLPEVSDYGGLSFTVLDKIARGEVLGYEAEMARNLGPRGNTWKVRKTAVDTHS